MKISFSLFILLSAIGLDASAKCIGPKDVPGLITQTYILAVVAAIAFILLAVLSANLIKFQGGSNPKDPGKRRLWFWLLGALSPIAFLLYNLLVVVPELCKGPAASKFSMHPYIGTAILLVLYIIIGLVLSKTMKRAKVGNWFPSKG